VVRELAQHGVRELIVVIMAAFYDRSTVDRYAAVMSAAVQAAGVTDLTVRYVASPEQSEGFYRANTAQIRDAYQQLPAALRADAKLLFTAHSVPTAVGQSSGYVSSFETTARRVAEALGTTSYRCVYQSRSGSPRDPWLEPDVCAALREEAAQGGRALVLAPIGFVCDHVEVLYDLDIEAAQVARELGLSCARAKTVGTHPDYIDALASAVRELAGS
jgi:ferrochelatase